MRDPIIDISRVRLSANPRVRRRELRHIAMINEICTPPEAFARDLARELTPVGVLCGVGRVYADAFRTFFGRE
jgi:hypothetical protein